VLEWFRLALTVCIVSTLSSVAAIREGQRSGI